jgi:hypothetical protein
VEWSAILRFLLLYAPCFFFRMEALRFPPKLRGLAFVAIEALFKEGSLSFLLESLSNQPTWLPLEAKPLGFSILSVSITIDRAPLLQILMSTKVCLLAPSAAQASQVTLG